MSILYPEEIYNLSRRLTVLASNKLAVKINSAINNVVPTKEFVCKIHTLDGSPGNPISDQVLSDGLGGDRSSDILFTRVSEGQYKISSEDGLLQRAVVFIRSEKKEANITVDMEAATMYEVPFEVWRTEGEPVIRQDYFEAVVEIKVYPPQ